MCCFASGPRGPRSAAGGCMNANTDFSLCVNIYAYTYICTTHIYTPERHSKHLNTSCTPGPSNLTKQHIPPLMHSASLPAGDFQFNAGRKTVITSADFSFDTLMIIHQQFNRRHIPKIIQTILSFMRPSFSNALCRFLNT